MEAPKAWEAGDDSHADEKSRRDIEADRETWLEEQEIERRAQEIGWHAVIREQIAEMGDLEKLASWDQMMADSNQDSGTPP